MDKLRIFLADDHAVVREGLKTLVNAQPDMIVIGEAGDGLTVWKDARDCGASVVIMDVSMPGLNGAQATAQLREHCPDIKVLALSVHEDTGYLRKLLEAGAAAIRLGTGIALALLNLSWRIWRRIMGSGEAAKQPARLEGPADG